MKNILSLFIILAFAGACTKKATIKLPEPESKIVVTCFISPEDSIHSAVVRLSTPRFGTKDSSAVYEDDIRDAVVMLSDGTASVTLPFDSDYFFYQVAASQFPVLPGKTYYLTVTTADGKAVSASATVPEEKLVTESLSMPMRQQDSVSFEQDISLVVQDIPGKVNYMGVFFYNTVITRARSNPNFPPFPGMNSWAYFEDDEKTAKTRFHHNTVNAWFGSDTIVEAWLDISLLNCSREFYLYNRSVQDAGFGGNPFADPVMVYTNIQNGFGCFGAYRSEFTRTRIR